MHLFTERRPLRADSALTALIVIDTIEESSLENLEAMKEMLLERPDSFFNEMEAIDYISNGGEMSNFTSAGASAPGRVFEREDGDLVWETDLLRCIDSINDHCRGWFEGYADAFLESSPYKNYSFCLNSIAWMRHSQWGI